MKEEKAQLIKDRWNWMVNERATTNKSVQQIKMEADLKFKGG